MKTFNQEYIKPLDCDDNINRDFDFDFDFEFSFAFGYKQLHQTPLFVYADELFDGGMIKPVKVCKDSDDHPLLSIGKDFKSSKTRTRRKDSRSTLSSRVPKLSSIFPANIQRDAKETMHKSSLSSRSMSASWNKKWKLKDLLLFGSVSEGHASTRDNHGRKSHEIARLEFNDDPSKYSEVKKGDERRTRQGISAHERHYKSNRKAEEEMKRKTFLPYKKTLLMGCSDLDPGVYEFCKGHAVDIKC